jgi:competence protein ComEC
VNHDAPRIRYRPLWGFSFATGAALVLALPTLPPTTWLLVALSLLLTLCWRLPRLIPLAALLAGLTLAVHAGHSRLADRLATELEGRDLELRGRIDSLPEASERSLRFDLAVVDAPEAVPGRLRLAWYEPGATLDPGACVDLTVRLKRPRGLVNPGGFDFERHATLLGIGATGYVVGEPVVSDDCARPGIDGLRAAISTRIDAELPPGRSRALVKALAIGDTREIDEAGWDLYRATGTTHLIAISGLHVGLAAAVGGGLAWLLWWLIPGLGLRWPRPQGMALAALVSAGVYALLAGFSLPTQRTFLTIAVMLAGVLTRRELGWWTRYSLALVAVLLIDPLAPLGAGFWLSFGAVAWLILAYSGRWAPQPWWRLWLYPQLGLAVALLPLGIAFFQQASLVAPPVNLLAVPYITFGVVPLLLAALLTWPLAPLSDALWKAAWWLLEGFDAALVPAAALPGSWITLPSPGPGAWLLAILGTLLLLAPRGLPWRWLGAFALLPLAYPAREAIAPGAFVATVLDVGQGQSVLVRTHRHALLIDTGPGFPEGGDLGDRVITPSLAALGVNRLDRLIVSHADSDHHGGTGTVLRRLAVSRYTISAPDPVSGADACLAGEHWEWDGVRFGILHPPEFFPYLGNESSCVVRIEAPGGSLLVPGDIGEIIEQRLLRERPEDLRADVLVAGHHGSKSSSSTAFLAAVDPAHVVYSMGYRNRFGFPREEVQERVLTIGARQWQTAESGAVEIRVGEAAVELNAARQRRKAWWREP